MTPERAIQIVDEVVSACRGTRQEHQELEQAIGLLRSYLPKPEEEPVEGEVVESPDGN